MTRYGTGKKAVSAGIGFRKCLKLFAGRLQESVLLVRVRLSWNGLDLTGKVRFVKGWMVVAVNVGVDVAVNADGPVATAGCAHDRKTTAFLNSDRFAIGYRAVGEVRILAVRVRERRVGGKGWGCKSFRVLVPEWRRGRSHRETTAQVFGDVQEAFGEQIAGPVCHQPRNVNYVAVQQDEPRHADHVFSLGFG